MPKIKFHKLAALVVLIGFAGWVATGQFSSVGSARNEAEQKPVAAEQPKAPVRTVAVITPPRVNHSRAIRISGQTEADKRATLLPLAYYSAAPAYRVPAVLRVSTARVTIEMPTSTGQRRQMRHVGTLEFSVRGEALSLGAFVEEGAADLNRLFVPFMDLTAAVAVALTPCDMTPTRLAK